MLKMEGQKMREEVSQVSREVHSSEHELELSDSTLVYSSSPCANPWRSSSADKLPKRLSPTNDNAALTDNCVDCCHFF